MDFSEDLKLRAKSYFKERHNVDLSDSQVIKALELYQISG